MALAKHVKPDQLLASVREHKHHGLLDRSKGDQSHSSTPYSARYATEPIPKYQIPSKGISEEAAYQVVHDVLDLDGQPNLNFASFVHTWMNEHATKLCMETISKNLIDEDEYPSTQILHTRAVSMLAHLWHAPHASHAVGTATTGSSEAIQLGGLAMKKIWQEKRKKAGKSMYEPGPNIVMGANAQVALEKFARYFDVEMRLVPVTAASNYVMDPKRAMEYVDENTIGVFVILGSTYQGSYENVKLMSQLLDEYQAKTGNDVPIHVDGASGAFVAPFATPWLEWDFRLPRVVSINTSGHKFGLAYVGVGFVVWRDKAHLHPSLVFELHYLGSVEYSFSLNFSRPAHPIIAAYYNLIQLGFEGYRNIALGDLKNARLLSRALEKSGYYDVVSEIHKPKATIGGAFEGAKKAVGSSLDDDVSAYIEGLPVVAFKWTDDFKKKYPNLKQRWVQTLLRARGMIVPNYELPPEEDKTEILRVVVRESTSEEMIDRIVCAVMEVTESLMKEGTPGEVLDSALQKHGDLKEGNHQQEDAHKPTGWGKPC